MNFINFMMSTEIKSLSIIMFFYTCSLNENEKSFPLALKKKTNNPAYLNITINLEE